MLAPVIDEIAAEFDGKIKDIFKGLEGYSNEIKNICSLDTIYYDQYLSISMRHLADYYDKTLKTTPKKKLYFGHCSGESCNGLIHKNGLCDICNKETCRKCLEKKEKDHICNKDTLVSITVIRSGSKACPGCGIPVQRVEGCYQMWCTVCHVFFDWETRKILNERGHNPHYVEWAEKNNVSLDTIPGGCGGIRISMSTVLCGDNPEGFTLCIFCLTKDEKKLLRASSRIFYDFYDNMSYTSRYNMDLKVTEYEKRMYKCRIEVYAPCGTSTV